MITVGIGSVIIAVILCVVTGVWLDRRVVRFQLLHEQDRIQLLQHSLCIRDTQLTLANTENARLRELLNKVYQRLTWVLSDPAQDDTKVLVEISTIIEEGKCL